MPVYYNGTEIKAINYNGQDIQTVNYNGQEFPLTPPFSNKWSGGIAGLPLIYDAIGDEYTNYIDIVPDGTGDNLIIAPASDGFECFLGGGFYYDEAGQLFKALVELDPGYPYYKIFGGSRDMFKQSLLFISPTSGSPYLKFSLCYMEATINCSWDLNNYTWSEDYNDEHIQFNPETHLFSGQTITNTWNASLKYNWSALPDGTGFTVELGGVNYGTIYLT